MQNQTLTLAQLLKDAKKWRKSNPTLSLHQAQDAVSKAAGFSSFLEAKNVLEARLGKPKTPKAALIAKLQKLFRDNVDAYYHARELMEKGVDLPMIEDDELTPGQMAERIFAIARPRNGEYVRIDLRLFDRCMDELAPPKLERRSAPVAGNNYRGVVSFRAECTEDVDRLLEGIGLVAVTIKSSAIDPGVEVEIDLGNHLSIRDLYDAMLRVPDGHVMSDTLRALPLSENSLERRDADLPPWDWAENDVGGASA